MTKQNAPHVLSARSAENYNNYVENENANIFRRTYRKYTKYTDYVSWPTPCEVAVEISRMANCEHLAAERLGQSKFDWAELTLKQHRSIPEDAEADQWVLRQWVLENEFNLLHV